MLNNINKMGKFKENMGWQCPNCFVVYAPHIKKCLCMVEDNSVEPPKLTEEQLEQRKKVLDDYAIPNKYKTYLEKYPSLFLGLYSKCIENAGIAAKEKWKSDTLGINKYDSIEGPTISLSGGSIFGVGHTNGIISSSVDSATAYICSGYTSKTGDGICDKCAKPKWNHPNISYT